MKEIGGYFEIESSHGNKEYYEKLIPLNSACNALLYLCTVKDIKKIYLPYYLCDSVFECLKKNNINVGFYNIDSSFKPIFNVKLNFNEYLQDPNDLSYEKLLNTIAYSIFDNYDVNMVLFEVNDEKIKYIVKQ